MRVTGTVRALMMGSDRVQRQGGQRVIRQQTMTDCRVGLDDGIFLLSQSIGFVQNGVRHRNLAQIVQKTAHHDPGHLCRSQAAGLCHQS